MPAVSLRSPIGAGEHLAVDLHESVAALGALLLPPALQSAEVE